MQIFYNEKYNAYMKNTFTGWLPQTIRYYKKGVDKGILKTNQ